MKTLRLLSIGALFLGMTLVSNAQSVDEILGNYFENTGGLQNWKAVKAVKFEGNVNVQGMQIPIEMIQTAEGKSMIKANFQGQDFYQNVFDGETLWGTNQMTMQAEKSDTEATKNYKNEMNDFPDPFINYKEKGYAVELIGKETMEGTEVFKVKLVKEPMMVDGKEEQDISFYYFDAENYVPIVIEREIKGGPGAGMVGQSKLSDYQEVDGLYFPHSMTEGVKDQPGAQAISLTKITLNPELDSAMFAFPESATSEEKK